MSTLKDILEQRGMPCCSGCGMRMKMMEGTCPDCGVNYGLSMGAKNAPGMSEEKEEEPTADYKLDKIGRKIKASKIVFNQGEDDSTKRVQENMKTTYKDMMTAYSAMRVESLQLEDEINEVLSKDAAAGEWISDFVHSDNPKFAGKSKEKRKQMALAAYYAKQKNEEVEMDEELKGNQHKLDKNKNGKLDAEDFKKLRKEDSEIEEGTGSLKPRWMLKKDPELAKKVKEKIDLAKKRQATYGDKSAGKSVSEEVEEIDEAEYKISTAQMGHAGKTTIKHIKNPDVTQRMAAHDVKSYADRIALLKDAKRKGNLKEDDMQESAFDWKNNPRETKDKTKTSTYHDVKKVSTGTVYTKQFDKDGTSKGTGDDAAKKAENAPKRGRGRPKKDKFAESVEILMSLSEEQFDSMMEDGFDTFFEAYEQLDELSKTTLGSYAKKASLDSVMRMGKAATDGDHNEAKKAGKRYGNVAKAIDKLTK